MNKVIKKLKINDIHSQNILGKDVVVAVLDSGISPHPDFEDRILYFKDFVNRIEDSNDFYKYHNIVRAPKNIYLARGEKYRQHISSLYRKDKKEIEYEIAFKK